MSVRYANADISQAFENRNLTFSKKGLERKHTLGVDRVKAILFSM